MVSLFFKDFKQIDKISVIVPVLAMHIHCILKTTVKGRISALTALQIGLRKEDQGNYAPV